MIYNSLNRGRSLLTRLSYTCAQNPIYNSVIRNAIPQKPYAGFAPSVMSHGIQSFKFFEDPESKLKFLVQQPGFPGQTDIGVGIKLGTRDEDEKSSGSLHYLQQIMHSKETLQETIQEYDFFQKTGSEMTMNAGIESTYAKISFFNQDLEIMVDYILDVVLGQKRMYEDNIHMEDPLDKMEDLINYVAYGGKGIGRPREGAGTVLTNTEFAKFQEKITPHNTIFSIGGCYNHQRVVELIKAKIQTRYTKFLTRQPFNRLPSKYLGGFQAFTHNPEQFQCAIAYESVSSTSPDFQVFSVLRKLIGKAESFSSGGPGKGMYARAYVNLMDKVREVLMVSTINSNFDDSGIFGLLVGGRQKDSKELVESTVRELKLLKHHIGPEELQRAKNILISELYSNVQRQPQRLQEMTKELIHFQRIKMDQFQALIRKVTFPRIKELLTRMYDTPPTIVYFGNEDSIRKAPSEKAVRQMLRP